jgi:hypothetical protein
VPPSTSCPGRTFGVFHDEPITDTIIVLTLMRDGGDWNFDALPVVPIR